MSAGAKPRPRVEHSAGGARPGAGRPIGRLGPSAARSISLPLSLWEKADRLVQARDLPSRSALFLQLLQRARE